MNLLPKYMSAHHMLAVPTKARRGHRIKQSSDGSELSCRQWVAGNE